MLDYFAIFTKGGALLWTLQFTAALKHSPVDALNTLIRGCLLEERSAESAFTYQPKAGAAQTLKWTFHNVRAGARGWGPGGGSEPLLRHVPHGTRRQRATAPAAAAAAAARGLKAVPHAYSGQLARAAAALVHRPPPHPAAAPLARVRFVPTPKGLGLVFVAAYQRSLSLLYVDDLLAAVKDAFTASFYKPGAYDYAAFKPAFEKTLKDCEARADAARRAAAAGARNAAAAAAGRGGQQRGGAPGNGAGAQGKSSDGEGEGEDDAAAGTPPGAGGTPLGSSSGEEEDAAAGRGGAAPGPGFDLSKLKAKSRKAAGGPKGRPQARRGTRDDEEDRRREASPDKKKKVRAPGPGQGAGRGAPAAGAVSRRGAPTRRPLLWRLPLRPPRLPGCSYAAPAGCRSCARLRPTHRKPRPPRNPPFPPALPPGPRLGHRRRRRGG
jgi:hypothetical protein